MLAFSITTLSPSLPWKSRVQLGLHHHNASHIVNSFSSASTLPESNQGKGKPRGNKSFTVLYLMSSLGLPHNVAIEVSKNASHIVNSFSSASMLPESNQGKGKLRGNESFTVSYLMSSLGLPHNVAIEVSKRVQLKDPNNPNSVLNLFRSYGFSDTQISILVKMYPRVLLSQAEKNLLPRLRFLQSAGFSNSELQDLLISNCAFFLRLSLKQSIIPCLETMKIYLDDDKEAIIAFKRVRRRFFVLKSMENIAGNIKVLRDIGVPQSSVSRMWTKFVDVAFLDHTKFVEYVNFAREVGVDPSKTVFINAIYVLSQLKKSTWQSKLDIFKRYGWTRDDTLLAFSKRPQIMMLSEENITKLMSFLLDEIGMPLTSIVRNPSLLCSSLEGRIIPRYSVIKVLKMEGLIKRKPGFISILTCSEEEFLERYVTRFQASVPELMNIYEGASGPLPQVQ